MAKLRHPGTALQLYNLSSQNTTKTSLWLHHQHLDRSLHRMYETICTLPLTAELFAQSISPSEPLLAVGLSTGHVQTFRLPPDASSSSSIDDDNALDEETAKEVARQVEAAESGRGLIDTAWRTRRHKGSCRTLAFSYDGKTLFTAGTDGVAKAADAETGRVASKIAIPLDLHSGKIDPPSLLHALTPQAVLLATDSGALHHYDIRKGGIGGKAVHTWHPHDDYVSSIVALPPTEASTSGVPKQIVSTGGTTLAVTDIRRGVLAKSEDQEEELLSSCVVRGLSTRGTNVGSKVVIGSGVGVLSLWERGVWDDLDERIVLDKGPQGGESVDALCTIPEGAAKMPGRGKGVVAGMGNGMVVVAEVGGHNGIVDVFKHDDVEGVVGVGFDVAGRMITGGGSVVKVWREKYGEEEEEEEAEEELKGLNGVKRAKDSDSDDWEDEESSEEEKARKRKRRRKGKRLSGANGTGFSFTGLD